MFEVICEIEWPNGKVDHKVVYSNGKEKGFQFSESLGIGKLVKEKLVGLRILEVFKLV